MEQKTKIKYTIDKKLHKSFKEIVENKNLDKNLVIEELISNYVIQNQPIELNIDNVLDKISIHGYSSLSKEEIELLEKS